MLSLKEAEKTSKCCEFSLISMDIVHALLGTIGLIVRKNELSDSEKYILYIYTIVSVILSWNGIFFNYFIRTDWTVNFLTKIGACAPLSKCTHGPDVIKRELFINIGSIFPTIAMMIFGQVAFWTSYHSGVNSMSVFGWFTAWLYVFKVFAFYGFIGYINKKFEMNYSGPC